MAACSSILAWKITWTEEPGSPEGCKESDTIEHMHTGTTSLFWIYLFWICLFWICLFWIYLFWICLFWIYLFCLYRVIDNSVKRRTF